MPKLTATIPTNYTVDVILDKDGKPLINLDDFCQVLDWVLTDAFDFFDGLDTKLSSCWPDVGAYVERDGKWYITVPQAYAFLPQAEDLSRIDAAVTLLEYTLPKALNQGELD